MRKILFALLCLLSVMGMTSCHEKKTEIEEKPTVSHTLLIYMVGDNNGMSRYCNSNIRDCIDGLKRADKALNLVIYKDVEGKFPELFLLKPDQKDKLKVDTVYIKQYSEYVNSADKNVLAEVVNTVFDAYPAQIKGFEYWSHGGSWLPDGWRPESEEEPVAATRASQYIGIDNYRYMQIWDLREALEKCPHLDYITFDACNMATAELAYELAGRCDYILGSAQEIMGNGFPYRDMMVSLSAAGEMGIYESLCKCVDNMQTMYPDNGSLSLIKSSAMEPLATAYAALISGHADLLNALEDDAKGLIQENWQRFGGGYATNTLYCYYDMEEVAEYLQGSVSTQLKEAVPYSYCADTYYSGFDGVRYPINRFCGLAISVPELFHLSSGKPFLHEGYHMTRWGKKMGY